MAGTFKKWPQSVKAEPFFKILRMNDKVNTLQILQ